MTTARSAVTTQVVGLVPRATTPAARTDQLAVLAVYAPPSAKLARTTQSAVLAPVAGGANVKARTTQVAVLVAYGTGVAGQYRARAWVFTLDGHTFYVLDLGPEGTFLYDLTTKQWCQFSTQGFNGQWNHARGTMWGQRIVGGDLIYDTVRELNPTAVIDEGWREIAHAVTGGVQTRSRVFISVEAFRLMASFGVVGVDGAEVKMRYSDDNGKTWSDYFVEAIVSGNYSDEIAFRSLGSFMAPGRIFEVTDSGGLIRIDGADAFMDDFDDDQAG